MQAAKSLQPAIIRPCSALATSACQKNTLIRKWYVPEHKAQDIHAIHGILTPRKLCCGQSFLLQVELRRHRTVLLELYLNTFNSSVNSKATISHNGQFTSSGAFIEATMVDSLLWATLVVDFGPLPLESGVVGYAGLCT